MKTLFGDSVLFAVDLRTAEDAGEEGEAAGGAERFPDHFDFEGDFGHAAVAFAEVGAGGGNAVAGEETAERGVVWRGFGGGGGDGVEDEDVASGVFELPEEVEFGPIFAETLLIEEVHAADEGLTEEEHLVGDGFGAGGCGVSGEGGAAQGVAGEGFGVGQGVGLGNGFVLGIPQAGGGGAGVGVGEEGGDEGLDGVGREEDAGLEQEDEFAGGGADADVARPGLAKVAGHFDEADGGEFGVEVGGAVAAAGVDDDDLGEPCSAGGQERREGPPQGFSLVAGDEDGGYRWKFFGRHRFG